MKPVTDLDFKMRPYTKRELATMYFPLSPSEKSAMRNLYNLMHRCTPLMEELNQIGYNPRCVSFLVREVRLIVKYLEEP